MKSVVFSPLAQSDIADIWDYSLRQWGAKQAVSYTQSLRDSCDALAKGHSIGQAVDVRDGYLKYRSGEHIIFYRDTSAEIMVIRILHKRMVVGRHL